MSRYFFYMFLTGMLINTIFFVPRILIGERYDGAVLALFLSVILGTVFSISFVKSITRFPGEGIPEIFARYFAPWFRIPVLLFFAAMWAIAGAIILIAFSNITLKFLSPETHPILLLLCFCGIAFWASSFRPLAVLNVAEIVILLNSPVVLYIMFKSLGNQWFNWDEVKVLTDYALRIPSWSTLAAATYPFNSYIHLALYNRLYKQMKVRHLWLIPVIGASVLFVSFVVPIGLLGVDAAADYIYVWITATDTIRMEFGFIERVSFLFLFIYIGFSLLFVTITWNVARLLAESCFKKKEVTLMKRKISMKWVICAVFAWSTFFIGWRMDDKSLIRYAAGWQSVRLAAEIFIVALVVWLGWRKKHAKNHQSGCPIHGDPFRASARRLRL